MAGKRTFVVTVTIQHDGFYSAAANIAIDPDDIYQAEIAADVRALARKVEVEAGLRENADLA